MARKGRMESLFPKGEAPLLWCPVLAHYNNDGTLDTARMLAHQSWLVRNGVSGFLVPGSTGDGWDMSMEEKLEFLRVCREIAAEIRTQTVGLDRAPYLLAGALEADEAQTIQCMDRMKSQASNDILGFCVCPPRGISDTMQMERSLSQFLERGYPVAVYQLPQVTQVTMPVDLLRRLADKYEGFLFFKDSSGKDEMALSGVGLDGVFMVRGAEGSYAEWLANPIPSGYHGFLLSTANVYPGWLTSLISKISAGAAGGNLLAAAEISTRISRVTDAAFGLVTGDMAADLGGNAFTNSAKAVDFWMAFGRQGMTEGRPLPLLKSGKRLPQLLVEKVGEALKEEGLMPETGYMPPELMTELRQPMFDPRATEISNEGAYKVLAKAQAVERGTGPWATSNKGVVHFEIGQPDYPTPKHIKDAGARAIADGKTTYTTPQGLLELRQSLCKHVERTRGVSITPEELYVGPGCKPGMYFVAQALLGAGDELLFPDPGFPQYNALATINGATGVPVPLEKDGATFKWDAFDKAMSSGKAKALIINSPSNPTGGIIKKADIERIVRACNQHGVWLLSDEIYSALSYDADRKVVSPLSIPGLNRDRFVMIDGFSKTYCMTGWRLGWAIMPPKLGELVSLLTVHAVGCTASFTQWAAIAALEGPQDCVSEMLTEYRRRRDYVVKELNSMPGVTCETPQGAFYAFPNVSMCGLPVQQLSDMILEEAGVATLPGTDFGPTGEGHIRISYVTDMATLEKGMDRLKTFFKDVAMGKYADTMPIPPYYSSMGLSSLSADN